MKDAKSTHSPSADHRSETAVPALRRPQQSRSEETLRRLLLAAEEAHVINTSSVNGFWASVGPTTAHTAYSAAKFAVKGFTEALMEDLKVNAPHVKASVVMPGHIGTSIVSNSVAFGSRDLTDEEREASKIADQLFHDLAPTTAAEAATIILDGVRDDRWRILVGDDAVQLDAAVRADPERAYEPGFGDMLFGDLRDATAALTDPDGG